MSVGRPVVGISAAPTTPLPPDPPIGGAPAGMPLLRAPHRVMFLGGSLQALLSMLWWTLSLGGMGGLTPAVPQWPLPPAWSHGGLMIFGFFPWLMFGFLMTAGPRWQNAPRVGRRIYAPAALLMGLGWLAFYLGLWLPALIVPGLVLAWTGMAVGAARVAGIALHPVADRRHIIAVAVAQGAGLTGFACLIAGVALDTPRLALAGLHVGMWLYLAPIFVVVGHRMVPFFSVSVIPRYKVYRPYPVLWGLLACLTVHGLLATAGQGGWAWPLDVVGAALAAHLWWRWQPRKSFAVRLLAVLHIGFAWLWIALTLYALQGVAELAGLNLLGLAPQHALTVGLFGSLVVAMVSRVTLGHSGLPLQADTATWAIFWCIQGAAVLRILADVVPTDGLYAMAAGAGLLWLAGYGWWVAKYAPRYWRARADGSPG